MTIYRLKILGASIFMLFAFFDMGCSVFGIRNYETPVYEVIFKEGNKEIRYYESYVVAKTTVKGDFKEAQGTAFRILAGYIFGDNEKKQEIEMTAPVAQMSNTESQRLPMTGPVIQSPSEQGWVMTFMMPSAYNIEDLPRPNDNRVSLETVTARHIAAIRYTWLGSKSRNDTKANELLRWLAGLKEYKPISSPMFAGYDPPWTLPFFRRNEMMIKINRK
jgi:hypothetical protein